MAPMTDVTVADAEAVRRQADQIQARNKLEQARAAEDRKDLVTAAKLYDDAWTLADGVGPSADVEKRLAATGVSSVRMQLAQSAQSHGDYHEADNQIRDVLRVNPGDPIALAFKTQNNQLIENSRGTTPSPAVIDQVKDIHEYAIETSQMVQDGKLLFQLGKLDEAEVKLKLALSRDPSNQAALYYLSLLKQVQDRQAVDDRNITSMNRLTQVEKDWTDSSAREKLPVPNLYARTNIVYTSSQRQSVYEKLNNIVFEKISFPGLQLSEVIRNLSEQTERRDPDQMGVNFMLDRTKAAAAAAAPAAPTIDPTTGAAIPPAAPSAEEEDLGTVTVSVDPPLRNMRLVDVLEAIVKSADHPIKYSMTDIGIEFSFKGSDQAQLYTRTFKVDPNTFYMGLQNVGVTSFGAVSSSGGGGGGGGRGGGGGGGNGGGNGATTIPHVDVTGGAGNIGGGGGNAGRGGGAANGAAGGRGGGGGAGAGIRYVTGLDPTSDIQTAVLNFFDAVGVPLVAPKTVFFNDRQGTLTVHATADDLDLIEAAINTLNIAPPEVTIRTRFVEVNQDDSKAIGFDWYLGNFLMNNKSIVGSGGSQPSFTGAPSTANPEGTFPGSLLGGTAIAPSAGDGLLTGGLRNSANAPALATVTGILTDPQFRVVLHALEQRNGADLLNEGQVTTLSGRQAQFQVVDVQTIVTGTQTGGNEGGNVAQPVNNGNTVIQNTGIQLNYTTDTEPFGTELDVVPYVCADGYTIQMTLIPTVTEFLQYDNPGSFIPTVQAAGSVPIQGQLPLPHSRVRQVTTSCIVWDGQTIVLGGLITESVQREKDKVPFLGDLPGVGRLFTSESNVTSKKNLVVFVTPTIVDPAGHRRNVDEEMPFARLTIPAQPPVK
jgi:type II secretory pathway component GspD/PulD (secretin)/tetratricopeptide (TPR) repeat protein